MSDHNPISLTLDLNKMLVDGYDQCKDGEVGKINWQTFSPEDLRHYTAVTKTNLNLVKPDLCLMECTDPN